MDPRFPFCKIVAQVPHLLFRRFASTQTESFLNFCPKTKTTMNSLAWLLVAILSPPPVASVPLHLTYFSLCAFHLVHFYGPPKLSESLLESNQYGQPWTVSNMSRPLLKPEQRGVNGNGILPLRSWESRFCNVHLLSEPHPREMGFAMTWGFEDYAGGLAVHGRESAFMILVSAAPKDNFLAPGPVHWYDLDLYAALVSMQDGGVTRPIGPVVEMFWVSVSENWHL